MPRGLSPKFLAQVSQGYLPNKNDLSPEEQQHLMGQPWFQKALDMRRSGVNPTPDVIQKLMVQPGSQGFSLQQVDPEDPKKGHILVDHATGKTVSNQDIIRPDFEPTTSAQYDENGNVIGHAMTTSRASAEIIKQKPINPLAELIKPGTASPVTVNGKQVGVMVNDGSEVKFHQPMDPFKALMAASMGGASGQDQPDTNADAPVQTPALSAARTSPQGAAPAAPANPGYPLGARATKGGVTYVKTTNGWTAENGAQ